MKWLKHNSHTIGKNFLIETKVVRPGRTTFSWTELSEKEIRLLNMAKVNKILATNSDMDRTGTLCDGYCLSGDGIMFIQWVRRGNKTFYAINIDTINNELDKGEKLLTEKHAEEICMLKGKII